MTGTDRQPARSLLAVLLELQQSYYGPHKYGPYICDLEPLAGLCGLKNLCFTRTPVQDLTPLAGLAGLLELSLDLTQVRNLTPLQGLSSLRWLTSADWLHLDYTQVRDPSPLAGMIRLQSLSHDHTPIDVVTGEASRRSP